MRALVQRVSSAAVTVEGRRVATIGSGLLVLLGVVLAFRGGLLGAAEALLSRRPWMSGPRTPAAARKDAA